MTNLVILSIVLTTNVTSLHWVEPMSISWADKVNKEYKTSKDQFKLAIYAECGDGTASRLYNPHRWCQQTVITRRIKVGIKTGKKVEPVGDIVTSEVIQPCNNGHIHKEDK